MPRPKKSIMDGKTRCSKCGELKPISDFYKDKKAGLRSICKDCDKASAIKWTKNNRKKHLASLKKYKSKKIEFYKEYKSKLKCQECGESHSACLEFHHRNPNEKEFHIGGAFWYKSIERVMNEIVKCDILCSNCHKKLHYDLERGA